LSATVLVGSMTTGEEPDLQIGSLGSGAFS